MLIVSIMLLGILGMMLSMTGNSLEQESMESLYQSYDPNKKDYGGKNEKAPKGEPGSATGTEGPTEPGTGKGTDPARDNTQKDASGKKEDGGKEKRNSKMPTFILYYGTDGKLVAEGSDFYDLTDTAYLEKAMYLAIDKGTETGVIRTLSLRFLKIKDMELAYSFVDISNEQSTLWNLFIDSILVGFIAFGVFLILSIFLARKMVRPVERAWERQQQFVADASHELKTPLTVIITGAELLENPELPEATRKQCVENILETSQRMRSLTEEMLNLARVDHVQKELLQENCDLSDFLEDSVMAFEPLFFERGLELEAQIDPGITVKGNQTQLRQLGELLLDNGQKYSLPGKTILTLKKQGFRSCELTLSNPASPVSEEELEKLFERFYRADPVRTASGSYGLGLAIARGIVQRHGGTIKAEQKEERIFFTVKLPIA